MDIIEIVKKLIAGLLMGCILVGTRIALMGLYLKTLNLSVVGLVLILVSILLMEILYRKLHLL